MEKSKVIKIKKRIDGAEYPFVVIKNENELDNKLLARIKKELDLINKKGCVIYSRKIIKNENNLIRKYDNKKYKIRIAYLINKKEIKWTPRCLDENEFEFFRFKKLKSLEKFCIKLYNNYCKKWSKKKNYSEFAKEKKAIKKMFEILKYDYLAIKKREIEVFVILYFNIPAYNDKYCDLIGHIEISNDIEKEKRKRIHEFIKYWLYKNSKSDYIVAEVDCFNIRSQKFFRKMGFKPKWLAFIKENF